jgi:hypothetical protein
MSVAELLPYAETYNVLGLVPIPVRAGKPLVRWRDFITGPVHWQRTIETWPWADADGIGLILGRFTGSGYWWTLDIEPQHRPVAETWLDGHVPGWREGFVAESQRGGLHVYCLSPEPVSTTKCAFGDVKGRGGLIYAPPTRAFKPDAVQDYRWLAAPPELLHPGPDLGGPWNVPAMVARAVRLSPAEVPGAGAAVSTNGYHPLDVAAVLQGVPRGERHDSLFRMAAKLRAAGVPLEWAQKLVAEAAANCDPPYPSEPGEEPVERLVGRVYGRYEPNPVLVLPRTDSTVLPVYRDGTAVTTNPPPADLPADSTDSTAYRDGSAVTTNPPPFRFRTPAGLLAEAPEQVPWLWEGYLARGALTVLGAREKAGKSTLTWALMAALLTGTDFCGRPTTPTPVPVVVLTEEPPATVAEKLERFGIGPDAPLSILTRADAPGRPAWDDVVAAAVAEAGRIGAGLVVIDTLAFWAALPPDAENSAGAMTEALRPLLEATGRGLAVLCLHHANKSHGELRGSTAIGAAADVIVTLTREPESPCRRRLEAVGRFADCPAEPVLVELEGNRYVALGTPGDVAAEERERRVLGALPAEPPGLTQKELAEATGIPQQRVAEVLSALLARGLAVRTGHGTRSSPYRYHRPEGGFDVTAAPPLYTGNTVESGEFDVTAAPPYRPVEPVESAGFDVTAAPPLSTGNTVEPGAGTPGGGPGFDSTAVPSLYTGNTVESHAVLALAERAGFPRFIARGVRVVFGPEGWKAFVQTATAEALAEAVVWLRRRLGEEKGGDG